MSPADVASALDESLPDIDWVTLPPGVSRFRFAAPSGTLAAVEVGDPSAERVVLVPGVTGSKEDFWFQLSQLAASGYFVQSFDLAGQYESAGAGPEQLDPPRSRYDYDLFVDDVVAFLERGTVPVHLLGYSFAGVVSELVAERRPDLV
ncbi:MAG: alpha/beta fold hydrolase, partial [Leifsonia flava]